MAAAVDDTAASSQRTRSLAGGVIGSARVIGFGASNVAPAGAVVAGLVIVASYAGFASPLVVLIAFAASLCCASSIAEFARRLPSAGWAYTYNSPLGPLVTQAALVSGRWPMLRARRRRLPR